MLILSGGGDSEIVEPIDRFFADIVDKEKVIVYIPIAMEEYHFSYESCLQWFTETYSKYGIRNIEMWTDLRGKKLSNNHSAIFIGGGNTYKLLKAIKDSNFDKECISYLNNRGIIYGGSAGAIIFGKTIDTAKHADKNIVELNDTRGLNVLGNKDVWCHYTEVDDELIKVYNNELYILYEASGIAFDNDRVIGLGKEYKVKW